MSTVREIKVGSVNYNAGRVHYGTCETAAATVAKVVSCPTFTADDLVAGAAIIVKNTTTNTGAAGSLTLDVNSTGAKSIKRLNNGALANIANAEFFASTLFFVYDGTYWILSGSNYNTTYSAMSQDEATTGTATSSRVITAKVLNDTITNKINAIAEATTTTKGMMSAADKVKLNGIAAGAEVNQNAFSNIKVGNITVDADTKTDTVEFVGSNVTITPDSTNDKVTFGITKANVTTALGYTPVQTNTDTYPSGLTWTAGTTAGPVPNISRAGTTTTAVAGSAIPAASATASGIVTTGAQTFAGIKTMPSPKVWHTRYPEIYFLANSATGPTIGEVYFDAGATNTISQNQFKIKAASPVSGGSTTMSAGYEYYTLPTVTVGLTTNATYSILTTKTVGTATAAQIKTGTDTGTKLITPKVASDALTENTYRLYGGTPTSNIDLNTYTTPGNYYCDKNTSAVTYTNNPYSAAASSSMQAFRLYVIAAIGTSAQYIYQKLEFYGKNDEWVRFSTNTGTSWSAWYNRSANTDTKVTQTAVTTGTYPLLITKNTNQTTTVTDAANFSPAIKFTTGSSRFLGIQGSSLDADTGYVVENIGVEESKPGAMISLLVGTGLKNYGLYSHNPDGTYISTPAGWLIRGNSTDNVLTAHLPATSLEGKLIGKSGAVTAGNYTTTMPTTTGAVAGQIMFVLKS